MLLQVGATLRRSVRASPWGGFSCCAHALGVWASVVVVPRPSCSKVCAILLDQGSNPCFPALADRFLSTIPPGKSQKLPFKYHLFVEETKASSNSYRICPYTGFGLHRWGVLSRLHILSNLVNCQLDLQASFQLPWSEGEELFCFFFFKN